jgi:uncharacterized protein (DUF1501 family)
VHPIHEFRALSRRSLLTSTAGGIGLAALLSLLKQDRALAEVPGALAFAPKAKRCIFFFMEGGPSQFDLFAYKPTLNTLAGQPAPASLLAGKRFAFLDKNAVLLATHASRTFKQHGQSGLWFSNLLPKIAEHADKICMLNAVVTNQFNHNPAQLVAQTGNNLGGHPSMGSWLNYGLGSENQNLPGYVVLSSAPFISGGVSLWSAGFAPSTHSGVLLQPTGDPILNLKPPAGVSAAIERDRLDALATLNAAHQQKLMDPEIASRIANYELSFRMQAEAPQLTDLSQESAATLERYGLGRSDPAASFSSNRKPPAGFYANFAKHCLLARRMIEKGVRFVNVFSGSWDEHGGLSNEVSYMAGGVDQPIGALLQDLSERGLLDETLVVWGSEFGRTPLGETNENADGRDHHPDSFSMFMAGGGVKGGVSFGETDDIGWSPISDGVDIADVHATILRLFGIDHMALSYPYRGVDQRLTPLTRVSNAIEQIIA